MPSSVSLQDKWVKVQSVLVEKMLEGLECIEGCIALPESLPPDGYGGFPCGTADPLPAPVADGPANGTRDGKPPQKAPGSEADPPSPVWLGRYIPISPDSPGRIELHAPRLKGYLMTMLVKHSVLRKTSRIQLRQLATLTAYSVFSHECFHHYSDVLRKMCFSRYDRLTEETLAESWSVLQLERQLSRMGSELSESQIDAFKTFRFGVDGTNDSCPRSGRYAGTSRFAHGLDIYLVQCHGNHPLLRQTMQCILLQAINEDRWPSECLEVCVLDPSAQDIVISAICSGMQIDQISLGTDGKWNVDGNVDISGLGLTKLPFAFGKVTGNFNCSNNKLASFEGFPEEIGGNLDCSYNRLVRFDEDFPKKIGGDLLCCANRFATLQRTKHYSDRYVGGYACFHGNEIEGGVLGLIRFHGLKGIFLDHSDKERIKKVQDIVTKYLRQGKSGIIDAQDELMNNDLDDYDKPE